MKSQWELMPAASTTRRSVSSPHFPCALDWNASTSRNCWVSFASVVLCCERSSSCFFTSPKVEDWAALLCCKFFLIRLQLLFERFDQALDGFLALREIALGGLLQFCRRTATGRRKNSGALCFRASALRALKVSR